MTFEQIIKELRDKSFSERDKGYRFERLMQSFLKTYPVYADLFTNVWFWNEFPSRNDFGAGDKDLGIDLVARTKNGDYWAIQCKCYKEDIRIDKPKVDTFLSASGRSFNDTKEIGKKVYFVCRLWIDTTINGFNPEAEISIQNQKPEVIRLGYYDLINAPVDWQKIYEGLSGKNAVLKKYEPKPHQQKAITDVHNHLQKNDRGKLIMACGTGKTFTSLRIAEKETGDNGFILFLVPSIALLGQTLREWSAQCTKPIHPICICSDVSVSKKTETDDTSQITTTDLALPASTSIKNIERQYENSRLNQKNEGGNIVVFSTYQSIDVISKVQKTINQKKKNSFIFDLIICDEAHRTTGVTLTKNDESSFVKVHDNNFINGKKRIYMTATPRIYSSEAQKKAKEKKPSVEICSMDDKELYGDEMHRIGFGTAVSEGLLSDYKVIVLTMEESQLSDELKNAIKKRNEELTKNEKKEEKSSKEKKSKEKKDKKTSKKEIDKNFEIPAEETLKIIGCINVLSKKSLTDKELFEGTDPTPMKSAVAFCQNIEISKATAASFNVCRDAYFETLTEEKRREMVIVNADHVDGTMGAQKREQKLHWLKSADASKRECNILHNVRCLSEGVDVPSLDAVMFLSARNSQIDIIQSVGRVMRKPADGSKKYGYIIIPVVVLPEAEPEKILSSDRFKIVWSVLNGLRAHDDRFDAMINKIELNKKKPDKVKPTGTDIGGGSDSGGSDILGDPEIPGGEGNPFQQQLGLEFAKFQGQIYAKIVLKCGKRLYWEEWAKDVANIAQQHIINITAIVKKKGTAKDEFEKYLNGLRKNINPSVTEEEAIEMLAQHIITQPVFEALFEDYSFVKNNTVSKSLEGIITALDEKTNKKDVEKLDNFYVSVKERASGIDNSEGKQKIIIELYDKFFRTAFPKVTEKLGIVYTPVEVVDFIIHSVEDVLKKEFGRSMSDENVHILDPFTGTGTFITRLLQGGIIKDDDLKRKYLKEIHANEIVLLAYYIASINIENVYHDLLQKAEPYDEAFLPPIEEKYAADVVQFPNTKQEKKETSKKGLSYTPFPGICLTDTFQLGETEYGQKQFNEIFPQNYERVLKQQNTPLRIIIGNPPYSVGQKSANDNAQNQSYPILENRIADTYAKSSDATNKNSLYDTYIKAFRWSTDRLDPENGGIICFVSNGSWLDGNAQAGFRSHFEKEFSSIYVFNLRGNCRTSGELRQKEAGNIFGLGSRTPISITLLVKNPKKKSEKAVIQYYDIGDYHSREKKLEIIREYSTISNINWNTLSPNEHNDWINFRNDVFNTFIPIGDKDDTSSNTYFVSKYSNGLKTARDHFCYNFSKELLEKNIKKIINFYNEQCKEYHIAKEKNKKISLDNFLNYDSTRITWNVGFKEDLERGTKFKFDNKHIYQGMYRPFCKQYVYFASELNDRTYQMPKIFPSNEHQNIVICIPGIGVSKDFSVTINGFLPDVQLQANGQCFPLYWYEKKESKQHNLFENSEDDYIRHDAISDFILEQAKDRYGGKVTKEDIFYYVYGILHHPDYRKKFANDLKKMLPRLPLLEKVADFWTFSKTGRELADLHLNYENQSLPKDVLINGKPISSKQFPTDKLIVSQITFPVKDKKDTIIYNEHITISNIPPKAYEYIVNGKSAIEWVMERYSVSMHKESGIKNDPNDWAKEHEDPQYILDLLLSVITVSIKTVDIVDGLPKVEWE
jgi:predicted helicase